jgi:hypothetical protein
MEWSMSPTLTPTWVSETLNATGSPQVWSLLMNYFRLYGSTTYYFRMTAQNTGGVTQGDVLSFTTLPPVPAAVTTDSATNVTYYSARLWGSTDGLGGADTYLLFQWGTTPSLGYETEPWGPFMPHTSGCVPSARCWHWNEIDFGEIDSDIVYYRAVSENGAGREYGEIKSILLYDTLGFTAMKAAAAPRVGGGGGAGALTAPAPGVTSSLRPGLLRFPEPLPPPRLVPRR